ncbi:MAG: response regulator, partial [Hyphomicrobiales bacterium]|nr:response regulator [Hyphomicrobiales bacterium]
LSMVYGFVKQSGGNIQLYSEPGRGTSVRIFLPVADRVVSGEGPGAAETQKADLPQGSETILLVEDDPRLLRVLSKRLRSLGYQIIEANNGAAALDRLAARPEIALVFTDMVMPGGMTGYDLAQAALAMKPGLKVLFTSGYAEPAIARLGLKAGAWLKKPYTADELAEKIREVLNDPEV